MPTATPAKKAAPAKLPAPAKPTKAKAATPPTPPPAQPKAAKAKPAPPKLVKVKPTRVLTAWQADYLSHMHNTGRLHPPEDLAAETAVDVKTATRNLKKLQEMGLVTTNTAGDKYKFAGERLMPLGKLVRALRAAGGEPRSLSDLGCAMWGHDGTPGKFDHIKFIAPAGKVARAAFNMGACGRVDGGKLIQYFAVC
jgi:hypothetical protein